MVNLKVVGTSHRKIFACLNVRKETWAAGVLFFFLTQKKSPPVVRPHAAVHHAYVFSDRLHFMDTLLIIQNGLLFLFCCKDNSIGSWKQRIPQSVSSHILTNDRCSNQLHLCNLIMHSIKGRWWQLELLSQCPSGWPIDLTGQITHPFMIIKQYCRQKDKTIAWHYFSMLNQKTISHTALSTCCFQHYADYMKWL